MQLKIDEKEERRGGVRGQGERLNQKQKMCMRIVGKTLKLRQ